MTKSFPKIECKIISGSVKKWVENNNFTIFFFDFFSISKQTYLHDKLISRITTQLAYLEYYLELLIRTLRCPSNLMIQGP